jgi:hypothetical protein
MASETALHALSSPACGVRLDKGGAVLVTETRLRKHIAEHLRVSQPSVGGGQPTILKTSSIFLFLAAFACLMLHQWVSLWCP